MKKNHVKLLKKIVETPSPTGFETEVANVVRKQLVNFVDDIRTDTMGSVHAAYVGMFHHGASQGGSKRKPASKAALENQHTLMFAAHMDEIGLMVTYISPEGFLSISAIGGVDAAILLGIRVDVHTKSGILRGVVSRKPVHLIDADDRKNVTALDKLVIDLGMPAKLVRKTVSIGDPITFAAGFELFGQNMAVSRAFDDKAGVFVGCRVMEELSSDKSYLGSFITAMTVQEEIGTRGAITSAYSIEPDVAIAFDVTHATDYPGIDKSQHGDIVCGKGPVIARGPNINPVVFELLVAAAKAEGINYQIEAEPSVTGTDARAIQISRSGIPTGLVSVPLRYMHTPTEVIDLRDLSDAVRLITRFAKDLWKTKDFIPGHPDDFDTTYVSPQEYLGVTFADSFDDSSESSNPKDNRKKARKNKSKQEAELAVQDIYDVEEPEDLSEEDDDYISYVSDYDDFDDDDDGFDEDFISESFNSSDIDDDQEDARPQFLKQQSELSKELKDFDVVNTASVKDKESRVFYSKAPSIKLELEPYDEDSKKRLARNIIPSIALVTEAVSAQPKNDVTSASAEPATAPTDVEAVEQTRETAQDLFDAISADNAPIDDETYTDNADNKLEDNIDTSSEEYDVVSDIVQNEVVDTSESDEKEITYSDDSQDDNLELSGFEDVDDLLDEEEDSIYSESDSEIEADEIDSVVDSADDKEDEVEEDEEDSFFDSLGSFPSTAVFENMISDTKDNDSEQTFDYSYQQSFDSTEDDSDAISIDFGFSDEYNVDDEDDDVDDTFDSGFDTSYSDNKNVGNYSVYSDDNDNDNDDDDDEFDDFDNNDNMNDYSYDYANNGSSPYSAVVSVASDDDEEEDEEPSDTMVFDASSLGSTSLPSWIMGQ